jgi:hypothetical protein
VRSPFSLASFSYPTDPSASVRAIASNASTVMAMLIKRQARRASDLLQPAFFVFAPQRSPENRRATSVSQVGQTTQWSSSGTGSNTLIAIVLSGPIGRLGIIPRALRPDPERTLVASHRMARIDVHQTLRIATANGSIGREARLHE